MEGRWEYFEYTSRKADEGWSSRVRAGKGGNISSLKEKTALYAA
jgi:hypothetical protein